MIRVSLVVDVRWRNLGLGANSRGHGAGNVNTVWQQPRRFTPPPPGLPYRPGNYTKISKETLES